ncbi:acyltransferase [Flavisolibacter sp. BT320]|nr:acyltransferase [Flavisolibacter longurius]
MLYEDKIGHKNNFDFTRFLLAMLVVFTHGYFVYFGPQTALDREPLWQLTRHQLAFGTLAVNFFFVISGFLVLQSLGRSKTYFDYLFKRVLRIYPAFVVAILLCALVVAPLGNGSVLHPFQNFSDYWSEINLKQLVKTCLFLKDDLYALPPTFQNNPAPLDLNTSVWTISFEFMCYLVLLGLGILGAFKTHKLVPLGLFLTILFLNCLHFDVYNHYNLTGELQKDAIPFFPAHDFEDFLNMEHLLLFFMAGTCFYSYRNYIPRSRYLLLLSAAAVAGSIYWGKGFEIVQSIFGSYLLFYFIFSNRIRLHRFARYGDLSYGIYLFGWPVQQLVILYIGKEISFPVSLLLTTVFLLPVAFASWHLVEKPALSLKKKSFFVPLVSKLKLSISRYL